MKKFVLAFSILFYAQSLVAQVVDQDSTNITYYKAQDFLPVASGIPFSDVRYVEAQGTAYYDLQWLNGIVITTEGKAYKDVPVRIDLLANKVHYKKEDGTEMVVGTPLRELKYNVGGQTIHFINGNLIPNKKNGWFQLLVNDSLSLIKSYKKNFEERTSYGGNQLYIKTAEVYYAYVGGTELQVKKPSDFVAILPAKKAEIEAEIKRLKSASKEEQLIGVAAFLNTLVK